MFLKTLWHAIRSFFYDLIVPQYCAACKKVVEHGCVLCHDCAATVQPVVSLVFSAGNCPVIVMAYGAYQCALQDMIRAKKYGDRVAARDLGLLMAGMPLDWSRFDVIIPVPLHWSRRMVRGFNQAEEMAYVLGRQHGIAVSSAVSRVRRTRYQAECDKEERSVNIKDAFVLSENNAYVQYHGKHIVIVDDLYTTGVTVNEIIKQVKKLKPSAITVLVAARVL